MARVDDYKAAFDLAAERLVDKDPALVTASSGARAAANGLELDFLGGPINVGLDPVTVSDPSGAEIGLTDQVLILHYLTQADGRPVSGQWIAYREVPGAESYAPVFYKRAIAPLLGAFGQQPALLPELAGIYRAGPGETGDESIIVPAFPNVPLMLVVWAGDDEFPAEANILMDKSISGYLSAEDIAWLAGRVVYPLAGMARAKGENK